MTTPLKAAARRSLLVASAAVAVLIGFAQPASGAIREVPQDFPTIQDAVDAANPGDTIAVGKRRNFENVTVPTGNLLIRGTRPGVFVDGYINGVGDGKQFDITANAVRIANMGLRNGDGIDCNSSNGCTAKKLRYSGEGGTDCFYSGGDRAKVLRSKLRNCGNYGVYISGGDDARISGNTFARTDSGCIYISSGEDATVTGNAMRSCEDGDGIYVGDDGAHVENNSARAVDGSIVEVSGDGARVLRNRGGITNYECYYVNGDNARVRNNKGSNCDEDGVYVSGANPKVTGNRIFGASDYGYYFDCSTCANAELTDNLLDTTTEDDYGAYITPSTGGLLIARNVLRNISDYGLYLTGVDDSRIARNVINSAGAEQEDALYLSGSGNTLTENRVLNGGGDGFYIAGGDNRLEDNVARGNGGDGFYLGAYADIVLRGNGSFGNGGDGFENDGSSTVVRNNRASGNHRDCANDGTIAVKQGNRCADGSNFNLPSTASRVRPRR